jgi:DNA-binding HxlR family transcriptional regulator
MYLDTARSVLANEACPVVEVINHVKGRWTLGILMVAANGPLGYGELERAIPGITRRMLTLKLRQLERDGLLSRTVDPSVTARVYYATTAIGLDLIDTLRGLTDWATRYRDSVAAARIAYDATQATPS